MENETRNTNRSEGIARMGYLIPGRDGIPGLDVARNSSAAIVVVAVVVALQAGAISEKIKGDTLRK